METPTWFVRIISFVDLYLTSNALCYSCENVLQIKYTGIIMCA